MVASTFMRAMNRKVVVTLSIYTVEASNEDQALMMDIRMKDMISNITIIMTFMMLEPPNCSPTICETDRSATVVNYMPISMHQRKGSHLQNKTTVL